MKYNLYYLLVFFCLGTISLSSQVTTIPFTGNTLIVKGEVNYLEIRGQGGTDIIIQEYQNSNALSQYYTQEINGEICTITLKHKTGGINLFVPQSIGLNIELKENQHEDGNYDATMNGFGNINLRDLSGNLEINTDGYHIQFKDINGLSSIVTYGDIQGKYINRSPGQLTNLDTYLGNVFIEIGKNHQANIQAKAEEGITIINPIFTTNNSTNLLSLHSEKGKYIEVDTLNKIAVAKITHPELKDQYITLFVKYWGAELYPEARSKLENLGHHDILEQYASNPRQKYDKMELADELMGLIEEHGVPDYKMVGNEMPFKAIEFLFPHFTIDFIEKHSSDLSKVLGRQVVKRGLDRKYRRYRAINH